MREDVGADVGDGYVCTVVLLALEDRGVGRGWAAWLRAVSGVRGAEYAGETGAGERTDGEQQRTVKTFM
jgi:hypothetical protein